MSNIPAILFTFDDTHESDYSVAFSYMQSKGMIGTSYIIQSAIDSTNGLTEAQIIEMDAAGWDIGNHTVSHVALTALTEAEQETEIGDCKTYLDGLGLTRASKHVAYPLGAYNADTLTAMTNLGMITGRTIVEGFKTIDQFTWYELPSTVLTSTTSLEYMRALVDYIKCYGYTSIFYMHEIVESISSPGQWLISDFQALVDHVYDNKIPTLTISQLYGLHSAPLTYTNPWYTP